MLVLTKIYHLYIKYVHKLFKNCFFTSRKNIDFDI